VIVRPRMTHVDWFSGPARFTDGAQSEPKGGSAQLKSDVVEYPSGRQHFRAVEFCETHLHTALIPLSTLKNPRNVAVVLIIQKGVST
jgi:hypothetical protein